MSGSSPQPQAATATTALGDARRGVAEAARRHSGAYPRHYLPHDDSGPARHVAHARRDLAALRRTPGDAENAARDVHTALAGPGDRGIGSPGGAARCPGEEGS